MTNPKQSIAYYIEDAVLHEPFGVLFSHNAWWNEKIKVMALMYGFKRGYGTKDACDYAGISLSQFKYFCKVHPEFYTVKERCEMLLSIAAKEGLARDIETNQGARRWYLERMLPEQYGSPSAKRWANSKDEK